MTRGKHYKALRTVLPNRNDRQAYMRFINNSIKKSCEMIHLTGMIREGEVPKGVGIDLWNWLKEQKRVQEVNWKKIQVKVRAEVERLEKVDADLRWVKMRAGELGEVVIFPKHGTHSMKNHWARAQMLLEGILLDRDPFGWSKRCNSDRDISDGADVVYCGLAEKIHDVWGDYFDGHPASVRLLMVTNMLLRWKDPFKLEHGYWKTRKKYCTVTIKIPVRKSRVRDAAKACCAALELVYPW
jgi:hypothetical protein